MTDEHESLTIQAVVIHDMMGEPRYELGAPFDRPGTGTTTQAEIERFHLMPCGDLLVFTADKMEPIRLVNLGFEVQYSATISAAQLDAEAAALMDGEASVHTQLDADAADAAASGQEATEDPLEAEETEMPGAEQFQSGPLDSDFAEDDVIKNEPPSKGYAKK